MRSYIFILVFFLISIKSVVLSQDLIPENYNKEIKISVVPIFFSTVQLGFEYRYGRWGSEILAGYLRKGSNWVYYSGFEIEYQQRFYFFKEHGELFKIDPYISCIGSYSSIYKKLVSWRGNDITYRAGIELGTKYYLSDHINISLCGGLLSAMPLVSNNIKYRFWIDPIWYLNNRGLELSGNLLICYMF